MDTKIEDQYSRIRVIGKGSFGQAVLVRRVNDGGLFVIKEVNVSHLSRKAQVEALNEVKILSALAHPDIVEYHESFIANKKIHIVMEYAEGGDLAERVRKQGTIYFKEDVRQAFLCCFRSSAYKSVLDYP
jgi:NIMA (never in mitosis gene a)-related kinase